MQRFVFSLILFAVSVSGAALAGGPDKTSVTNPPDPFHDMIVGNEQAMANAEHQRDRRFFESHAAADLIYVAFNGMVFTRDKVLEGLPYLDLEKYEMKNFKVRRLGSGNAAVVTYDLVSNGKMGGDRLPHASYASSVWEKRNGTWLMVLHQDTPAHHN